jgi:hypothetical protein
VSFASHLSFVGAEFVHRFLLFLPMPVVQKTTWTNEFLAPPAAAAAATAAAVIATLARNIMHGGGG